MSRKRNRVPYTEEMKNRFRSWKEKTGWGGVALHKHVREINPYCLSVHQTMNAIQAIDTARSIDPNLYRAIIAAYESLPENLYKASTRMRLKNASGVMITEDMRKNLALEFERTGSSCKRLGITAADNGLKGLTGHKISSWRHGRTKIAEKSHWDFVLNVLKQAPNAKKAVPSSSREFDIRYVRTDYVLITPAQIEKILYHKDRTGLGWTAFLRVAEDNPDNIAPEMITAWVSGATRTAHPENIRWVIDEYSRLPTRRAASKS